MNGNGNPPGAAAPIGGFRPARGRHGTSLKLAPPPQAGAEAGSYRKHILSLYVSNKPGVLIRVALVFARRGFNIDSLVVSEGHDPDFSHMTITARGEEKDLNQILSQLNKLVDVVHATDHTGDDIVRRELALIKVRCPAEKRGEILQIAQMFQCEALHLTDSALTLQATGEPERIDALHRLLASFGVLEMVRTGHVLIARGEERTC
jgi:acetolactate synthase-1/3 small subunit